jgi:hypothetical protein
MQRNTKVVSFKTLIYCLFVCFLIDSVDNTDNAEINQVKINTHQEYYILGKSLNVYNSYFNG